MIKSKNARKCQGVLIEKMEAREAKQDNQNRADNSIWFCCGYKKKIKLYYTQKLKTFNFTVQNLANAQADNFMWHEMWVPRLPLKLQPV